MCDKDSPGTRAITIANSKGDWVLVSTITACKIGGNVPRPFGSGLYPVIVYTTNWKDGHIWEGYETRIEAQAEVTRLENEFLKLMQ